jgi:hypothetical protein
MNKEVLGYLVRTQRHKWYVTFNPRVGLNVQGVYDTHQRPEVMTRARARELLKAWEDSHHGRVSINRAKIIRVVRKTLKEEVREKPTMTIWDHLLKD